MQQSGAKVIGTSVALHLAAQGGAKEASCSARLGSSSREPVALISKFDDAARILTCTQGRRRLLQHES